MIVKILLKMKWTILIIFTVLTHVNITVASSEWIDSHCSVDGNTSTLSISYLYTINVSHISWNYKNKPGHIFNTSLEPCISVSNHQYNIIFKCNQVTNCVSMNMQIVMPDVWSEMNVGFHYGNGKPMELSQIRTACKELTSQSIVTTAPSRTNDTPKIDNSSKNVLSACSVDGNISTILIYYTYLHVLNISVEYKNKSGHTFTCSFNACIGETVDQCKITFNCSDLNIAITMNMTLLLPYVWNEIHVGLHLENGEYMNIRKKGRNFCETNMSAAETSMSETSTSETSLSETTIANSIGDSTNYSTAKQVGLVVGLGVPAVIMGVGLGVYCNRKLRARRNTDNSIEMNPLVQTFSKVLTDQEVKETDTLVVECEVKQPNLQVCWQKDRHDIRADSRVQILSTNCFHKLEIAHVTKNDGGTYTCKCGKEKTKCKITVQDNEIATEPAVDGINSSICK